MKKRDGITLTPAKTIKEAKDSGNEQTNTFFLPKDLTKEGNNILKQAKDFSNEETNTFFLTKV